MMSTFYFTHLTPYSYFYGLKSIFLNWLVKFLRKTGVGGREIKNCERKRISGNSYYCNFSNICKEMELYASFLIIGLRDKMI